MLSFDIYIILGMLVAVIGTIIYKEVYPRGWMNQKISPYHTHRDFGMLSQVASLQ